MSEHIEPDFMFKLIIVGDSGVGKTNILTKFTDNIFKEESKPTIGVELAIKTFIIDKMIIKTQIWDTAGQERFRAITAAYYRSALGVIIAFDLTSNRSFEHLRTWFKELQTYGEASAVVLIVGNKSDLQNQREVKYQNIEALVNEKKCLYLETSAANGKNIEQAFNLLVKEVYSKQTTIERQKSPSKSRNIQPSTPSSPYKVRAKSRTSIKRINEKEKKKCC